MLHTLKKNWDVETLWLQLHTLACMSITFIFFNFFKEIVLIVFQVNIKQYCLFDWYFTSSLESVLQEARNCFQFKFLSAKCFNLCVSNQKAIIEVFSSDTVVHLVYIMLYTYRYCTSIIMLLVHTRVWLLWLLLKWCLFIFCNQQLRTCIEVFWYAAVYL